MPPRMIRSTSACRAIRASSSLYGSPLTEKIGSFWLSTRVLNRSIIGIPVRIMFRGMIRFAGFTEGPPISIISSFNSGLPSRGDPVPSNTRPRRLGDEETRIGLPRKRTWSPVDVPVAPLKICNETRSPSSLITFANEVDPLLVTTASSPFATPSARTVMTFPTIDSIFEYIFCMLFSLTQEP